MYGVLEKIIIGKSKTTMEGPVYDEPKEEFSSSLLHNFTTAPLPDVCVQLLFHVFLANVAFTMGCMLIGAIPYYHYFGFVATRNSTIVFSILWVLLYFALSYAVIGKYLRVSIGLGLAFWFCSAVLIGLLSALLYNITPIQLMVLSWGQSIAMVIYTRVSPRYVSMAIAGAVMTFALVFIWCISIYGFIVEQDWAFAVGILCLAFAIMFYNLLQVDFVKTRYDASWEQGVYAVCRYYCEVGVVLLKYIL